MGGSTLCTLLAPADPNRRNFMSRYEDIYLYLFAGCSISVSLKWKGYGDADNTYVHITLCGCWPRCSRVARSWEPFKSFENSGEGVVERFWERIDTQGRDVDSVEGWTNGEEVFPTGPPRMPPFIERRPLVIYCSSRPKGQAIA